VSRDLAEAHRRRLPRGRRCRSTSSSHSAGNVIRGGREWVPAILRYNRIPARVLGEGVQPEQSDDRRLLRTRAVPRGRSPRPWSRRSWTSTAEGRTNAAGGRYQGDGAEKNRISRGTRARASRLREEVDPMRIRNGLAALIGAALLAVAASVPRRSGAAARPLSTASSRTTRASRFPTRR
jgi:hypothetical protein